MNNLPTNVRRGVVPVTYQMRVVDFERLLAGLRYIDPSSFSSAAFVPLVFAGSVAPGVVPTTIGIIVAGTVGIPVAQDSTLGWLRASNVMLPDVTRRGRRVRQLRALLGSLPNAVAYQLSVGPDRIFAFCARLGPGGAWLVAYAHFPEP